MNDVADKRKRELFDEGTASQVVLLTVLGIGVIGLFIAIAGMIIGHEPTYLVGLYIASPLYLIVLPICIILVGLLPVVCAVQAIAWLWRTVVGRLGRHK